MTSWWRKGQYMPSYVTKEHFDATIDRLDSRMDSFVTKDEFRTTMSDFRSENATRFDELVTILKRLDQERVFTAEWIRRIESDVDMVKKHLKLA